MKLYKKIVYSVLAMTLVGNTLSSCSDFLDEELTTQLSTDYFDTDEGITELAKVCIIIYVFIFLKSGRTQPLILEQMSFV